MFLNNAPEDIFKIMKFIKIVIIFFQPEENGFDPRLVVRLRRNYRE